MPALGESVTEGTVTRWLKSEGDFVKVDEPLLEVSTDKVDTEIPSPAEGILTRIVVPVDSTVAVGAELAVIGDGGSASAPSPVATPVEAPVAAPVTPVVETPAPVAAPVAPATTGSASGVVVTMPALGESVTEGTVTRWLKNVGDTINVDEPLLEVSTDKVDTEIPSPASGTILAIDVAVDSTARLCASCSYRRSRSCSGCRGSCSSGTRRTCRFYSSASCSSTRRTCRFYSSSSCSSTYIGTSAR